MDNITESKLIIINKTNKNYEINKLLKNKQYYLYKQ